eukprot:5795752-Amphidinium_carterae.1
MHDPGRDATHGRGRNAGAVSPRREARKDAVPVVEHVPPPVGGELAVHARKRRYQRDKVRARCGACSLKNQNTYFALGSNSEPSTKRPCRLLD